MSSLAPFMRYSLRLLVLTLIVLLIGCGSISSPPSPSLSKNFSDQSLGSTSNSNTSFSSGNIVNDFDVPNLLHISPTFICGINYRAPNTLVFSSNRLTYSNSEIQQMRNFFRGSNELPPTFQWVSGNIMNERWSMCGESLQVTNISSTTIQLSQINIRLTMNAQPNHTYYRVVNACSFINFEQDGQSTNSFCFPSGGGLNVFRSDYSLSPGKANTTFPGRFYMTDDSGASIPSLPTLKQGDVAIIFLSFSTHAIPSNFTYSIIPELVLNEGNTESRVNLEKLSTTIAFAEKNQFTCYNLKGNTFVPTELLEESGARGSRDTACI